MKILGATLLVALMLLAVSCKKESSIIQSSRTISESATQTALPEASEPAREQTVIIGKQVWHLKDLATSNYRNGDEIPHVQDSAKWSTLTSGAWCWYENDPRKGKLYNWYAIKDPRNLAPAGWHVPNDAEWTILTNYLGGESYAGGRMKEAGTDHWKFPNSGATNSSKFTGLPGGYRNYEGNFSAIGRQGYWWSSSKFGTFGSSFGLVYDNSNFSKYSAIKQNGFSVRCIED